MKYLSIDYGEKKIGLALSDELGKIAFPNSILKNDDEAIPAILSLIEKEHVKEIVIGESLNQEGSPNSILEETKDFGALLSESVHIPIHYEKEFFTSTFARQFSHGKFENTARKIASKELGHVDAHAAALILQRFLDRRNQENI